MKLQTTQVQDVAAVFITLRFDINNLDFFRTGWPMGLFRHRSMFDDQMDKGRLFN